MDRILVIIVTYNAHQWIRQCLSSIDVNKYDVLVVDNASEDDTIFIIRNEFSKVKLVCSDINLGFGKANNIGLQKAIDENYDFVLLLNQDAWLEKNTIEALTKSMKGNNDYGIISPIQRNSNENDIESLFKNYLNKNNVNVEAKELQEVDFVNAAIWLISRKAIELVGAFDPIYPHYGEDSDYVNRLHYWGKKIGVDTSVTGYHDRATKHIKNNKNYSVEVLRLEIIFLSMLNNINYSLMNRIYIITCIFFKKFIKFLLYGNITMVRRYYTAYIKSLGYYSQVNACRKRTIVKKAYIL